MLEWWELWRRDGFWGRAGLVAPVVATAAGISRITSFGDPGLVTAFGFPAVPPD